MLGYCSAIGLIMNKIIRLSEVITCYGLSKSTIYKRISDGLFPKPINLGGRAVGWPELEISIVINALIAEKSPDEIKALVLTIIEQRKTAA